MTNKWAGVVRTGTKKRMPSRKRGGIAAELTSGPAKIGFGRQAGDGEEKLEWAPLVGDAARF